VLARRKGATWYVAGINGRDEAQTLEVPLAFLAGIPYRATVFADSGQADAPWDIRTATSLPTSVTCQPRGGFVWVIETENGENK
jgi:hypothetical protein